MLLLSTLYLSLVFSFVSYADVDALGEILYCEMAFYQQPTTLSQSGYTSYRAFVFASFGVLLVLPWLFPALKNGLLAALQALRTDTQQAFQTAKRHLAELTLKNWLLISAIFGVIAATRLYFLLHYPLHTDETATFDYFVMEGIEAVTGFYPIPNNHVFQNVLNWVSYQAYPNFIFAVRGTSYLVSFIGLFFLFILLYIAVNLRAAMAFVLMIGGAYMPLYFSVTGRGYALLLILAGIGFISVYYILKPDSTSKRLHYFVFTGSSILGLYTVPTYLYTFAAYCIILFAAKLIRKQYNQLLFPVGIGAVVGLTTLVLYSPIIAISGTKALFGNPYIAPQDTLSVLLALKSYFVMLEGNLVGQERVGYLLSIGVMLTAVWLVWKGKLSPDRKLLCLMALASALLPYIFFLVQSVIPPERTVSYKAFYFFLLAAIIADTAISSYLQNKRTATMALGLLLVLYFGYEVNINYKEIKRLQPTEDLRQAVWEKTTQHNPTSMYITDSFYQLFFLHNAKLAGKNISFYSDFEQGKTSDILILNTDSKFPSEVLQNYLPLYQDSNLKIYRRRSD